MRRFSPSAILLPSKLPGLCPSGLLSLCHRSAPLRDSAFGGEFDEPAVFDVRDPPIDLRAKLLNVPPRALLLLLDQGCSRPPPRKRSGRLLLSAPRTSVRRG